MGPEWGSEPGDSSSCSLLPAPRVQAVDGPRGIAFLGSTVRSQSGRHTGPHFGRPKPVLSSVTILLWNAHWQINKRQAAPLCTHMERAPGYILRAKNQVIEHPVLSSSRLEQLLPGFPFTHPSGRPGGCLRFPGGWVGNKAVDAVPSHRAPSQSKA